MPSLHVLIASLMLALVPLFMQASEVPATRVARLAKGVNLSHWFSQVHPADKYTIEYLQTYIDEGEIAQLAKAGFSHVRLPVDPTRFFIDGDSSRIDPAWMAELDKTVAAISNHQMGVIIDLHAFGSYISKLEKDDAQIAKVAATWTSLAGHLSNSDPEFVFLELMNEPKMNNAERYQFVIEELHKAVRAAAPQHTIIISGKHFSGAEDLAALKPLADPNIIYNFHCYEPMIFSHQGAHWAWKPWESCKGVPYPSDSNPAQLATAKENADKGWSKKLLDQYKNEGWNKAKLGSVLDTAKAWATQHDVAITCNEFGVYKPYSPADSRSRWIRDIREAMEERDIGWCMWDYKDSFGITLNKDGEALAYDPEILTALGLQP